MNHPDAKLSEPSSMFFPMAASGFACDGTADVLQIKIYHQHIPDFVAPALEKLYENIYCTTTRFALYGSLAGVSTYTAKRGDALQAIILFRLARDEVEVLNQQIVLTTEDIREFCSTIYARYDGIRRISFHALDGSLRPAMLGFPFQEIPRIEENITPLPGTQDEFIGRMRAQTRNRIRKHIRQIKAAHPSYTFDCPVREEIRAEDIEAVVALADLRMASKNLPPYIASSEVPCLVSLARSHGCLARIHIDGRLVAGTLLFSVGRRYFSRLISHDPRFDPYGLGNQLQLQAILWCIDQGATEFWMMGGNIVDKARFLTERRMLNGLTVYRSTGDAIRGWRTFGRNAITKQAFDVREAMRSSAGAPGVKGQTFKHLIKLASLTRLACKRAMRLAEGRRSRLQ